MNKLYLKSVFLAVLLGSVTCGHVAMAETSVIQAGAMLDVNTGKMHGPVSIVIENELIQSINPDTLPADATIIDLGNKTLLPGLLDMHTHLTLDFFTGDDWVTMPVLETAADWAIRGVIFADLTLQAGFTTVRDVGANAGFPDVALMRAIDRGMVSGPRMWPAGHYISITGGHCDVTGFAPGVLEFGPKQGIADGVDEVIKAVRYQAKHGVRIIKVCATAGVFSFSKSAPIGAQQYSLEELQAIVREATKLGLKVAAHAHGTEGINAAIKAGVASIEHGSILSDESIRLMIDHGTYLVPNLYINGIDLPPDTPKSVRDKNDFLKPLVVRNLQRAHKAGVKLALGTDSGVYHHGENGREFAALVENGIPPLEAIQMATINAADLLGVDDRGEIATGRLADLIAVNGNPLQDIKLMENVSFVMKGGKVYKNQ
jgi:imidazolonepropionase-like amidohydrolase